MSLVSIPIRQLEKLSKDEMKEKKKKKTEMEKKHCRSVVAANSSMWCEYSLKGGRTRHIISRGRCRWGDVQVN